MPNEKNKIIEATIDPGLDDVATAGVAEVPIDSVQKICADLDKRKK